MSQITVATMTWVRTPKEETLLRRTLTSLAGCGLPVAVADGGTNRDFLHFLQRCSQFSVTVPAVTGQRSEDDEERAHRMRQLSQNVLGLVR